MEIIKKYVPKFRDCTNSSLVRDLATFHIYFDLSHIPAQVPRQDSLLHKVIIIFIIHADVQVSDYNFRDQTACLQRG